MTDYVTIMQRRARRAVEVANNPRLAQALRVYYRDNPITFVMDWGVTLDPRNIERGLPAKIPFVPFQRQIEYMQWILNLWKSGADGLCEKTRDMGCSVCTMSLFATLALFNRDFVAGVGSRKEMLVDNRTDPSSLFHKADLFLRHVPPEFRGGWKANNPQHRSHMRIVIPETGSYIGGEAGDNIGRGGRTSIYLVDEAAHNRDQQSIDAALSQTTRCKIDLSSVAGMANAFAEKRFSGRVSVFNFHWRDDPRKGQDWYDREAARLPAVIVAQEIDINYNAAQDNILIPGEWVQAAIDFLPAISDSYDELIAGLDVADKGIDINAIAVREGHIIKYLEGWSGNGSDIYVTTERAIGICEQYGAGKLRFDADGLGVGVRGDARKIQETTMRHLVVEEHQGSRRPVNPDAFVILPDADNAGGRTNGDFFSNYKSQSWWALRTRFENTFKVVRLGESISADKCISIPKGLPNLNNLVSELSQVTYGTSVTGKILINKQPDGTRSPNFADAVVIAFSPVEQRNFNVLDIDV